MRRPKRRWLMGAAAVSAAVVMMPGIVRAAWPQPEGWPTILSQSAGPEVAVARGVKEQDAVLTTDAGPLVIHRLDVDLTAPQLTVRAVAAGDKVFAGRGETVSSMANRTGAVAGINGDFYDIGQTYGPLNILVADGQLYRSPIGWAALAIDGQNRASIVKFQWNGRMMVLPGGENLDAWTKSGQKAAPPQGQGQPLAAFNSFLGDDGIFLYDDKFGYSFPAPSPGAHRVAVYLSKTADPAIYTVDSVVENRAVSPVSPGKAVLIGHGQWADWLAGNLAAGEKIEVMLNTAPDWRNYRTVVGGGPILLKDGQVYDDPNKPLPGETGVRNPIMAVGLSADGRSMVMVAVDGRQPGRSIGLTQREMAAYLLALGYRDAMAFDSGGSVDMVVRRPGQEGVAVVNSPSDGFERAVADGLFVYSSLPPEPPSPPGGTQPSGGGTSPGSGTQPGGGAGTGGGTQPGGSTQPGTGTQPEAGTQPGQNPRPSTGAQPGGGEAVTLPDAGSLITGRPQVWQETVAQSRNGSELTVQVLQETADRVKSADPGTTAFLIPLQADAATFDVHIPASVWQAVADKTGGAGVVVIQTPLGAYRVPVGAVDLGSGGKEVQVTVGRADSSAAPLQALLDQTGGTLAGGPVDFAVRRVDGGGSPAVVDYGGRYLRGLISLGQADAGPGDTGVFLYDANRGGWVPAPVRFLATAQGKEALVAQPAAGVYAVIRHPKTFDDLQGHWAGDQVAKMAAQGVIAGVDERHFAPDAPVTRGQFAVMLVRALGLETVRANRAPFADVPADAWDRHEIDVAVQEGLMSGIGDGRFADGDPMTREQMMAVLGRAMRIVGGSVPAADPGVLSRFADRSAVSDWAGGDVAVAVQTGVVVGSDGRLDPGRAASRAEAATMLGKMLAFLGLAD